MSKSSNRKFLKRKPKSEPLRFVSQKKQWANKVRRTKNAINKLRNDKQKLQQKLDAMGNAKPYSQLAKDKAKIKKEIDTLQQQIKKLVQEKKTPAKLLREQKQRELKAQLKQAKIEEEKRRQQMIIDTHKRYNIPILDSEQLAKLSNEERQRYLERETKIATGQYQKDRAMQWINNYKDRLIELGYQELVEIFEEHVNINNADLLSSLLPKINMWYDDGSESTSDKIAEVLEDFLQVMDTHFNIFNEDDKEPTIKASDLPRKGE